jgi:hypothetical protein
MVTNVLPSKPVKEIEIREFLDASGRSPYARWFEGLNAAAAARAAWAEYKRRKGGKE